MLFAAKCYWPGITETELERVAVRATQSRTRLASGGVVYLGSLLFNADDLVLCLFEGPSRTAVKRATESVGIPCERLIDSVWLAPDRHSATGASR